MKKILCTLLCLTCVSSCFAFGPSELSFNGIRFYKSDEKNQNNVKVAEYEAADGNSSASITLTHVLDKNDPGQIAAALKQKKSIEVMDIEKLNPENTDVLVSFVKFDTGNLKVENNLCRIFKNPGQNGSVVFQYIESKKMKNQAEGATIPDFTQLAQNMKQIPVDQYTTAAPTAIADSKTYYDRSGGRYQRYTRNTSSSYNNVPWYKRPGARTGPGAVSRDFQPARERYRY